MQLASVSKLLTCSGGGTAKFFPKPPTFHDSPYFTEGSLPSARTRC